MHYQRLAKSGSLSAAKRERHGEKADGRVSPEYTAWQQMRDRCTNAKSKNYPYYGGRGIKVCGRWSESFEAFLADVGRRPSDGHTLDRKDSNGHYEPGNVRWATRAEQSRNRRPFTMVGKHPLTKNIEASGATRSIAGWARATGIDRSVIRGRLKRGWDPARAVTEPVGTTPSGPKRRAA